MKSFAVIRGDCRSKVNTTLRDLVMYAHMSFDDSPKEIDPEKADILLVDVMNTELKSRCSSAAVVPLMDDAGSAIGKLRKIHPPAHVIIVSPQHFVFYKLASDINRLPEMELHSQEEDLE